MNNEEYDKIYMRETHFLTIYDKEGNSLKESAIEFKDQNKIVYVSKIDIKPELQDKGYDIKLIKYLIKTIKFKDKFTLNINKKSLDENSNIIDILGSFNKKNSEYVLLLKGWIISEDDNQAYYSFTVMNNTDRVVEDLKTENNCIV